MNRHLAIKTSCSCVAYMDVAEEREQGCGSFVKLSNSPLLLAFYVLNQAILTCNLFDQT